MYYCKIRIVYHSIPAACVCNSGVLGCGLEGFTVCIHMDVCMYCVVRCVHTVGIKKSLHYDPQYMRITYVLLCAITLHNNREYRNYVV